jgi:flagellar protein FlaI
VETSKTVLEENDTYKIVKEDDINPRYLLKEIEISKEEQEIVDALQVSVMEGGDILLSKGQSYEETEKNISELLDDMFKRQLPFTGEESKDAYKKIILRKMFGYGRLQPLVDDDNLEEIMINGPKLPVMVFHRRLGMCETNISFDKDSEIKELIDRVAFKVRRRIDLATPLMDARLSDGSRVNATLAPISLDGGTLTIRKFKTDPLTILELIKFGTLDLRTSGFLWLCVEGMGQKPLNTIVVGGSGSGKTTTLNCLADFIPTNVRTVTIEDTAELNLRPFNNLVRLETRPPNVEGRGEVSMQELMRNALRMRPDRIIVGEVRGHEATTLFTAMNTGHDGCMGTLHTNSAGEAITRLTNIPMEVPIIMLPALDLIVVQRRMRYKGKNVRRITEISEVRSFKKGEKIELSVFNVFEWDAKNDSWTEIKSMNVLEKISKFTGITTENLLKELQIRETILEWMIRTGVEGRESLRNLIQRYYVDKEGFMEMMVGDRSGKD